MSLRFRVALGPWVEIHEVPGPDALIGSDAGCDLRLSHPSVSPRHALLLERRGRLIAIDLLGSHRGLVVDGRRVTAPVVLGPDAALGIGSVTVTAERLGRSTPTDLAGVPLGTELEAGLPGLRRRRLGDGDELVWATSPVDGLAWAQKAEDRPGRHHSRLVRVADFDGAPALVEAVPAGVRLSSLGPAEALGVRAPLGARVLVLAHLAQALHRLHGRGRHHGALFPSFVQLGEGGRAVVLAPPPAEWSEPEPASDCRALAGLGLSLGLGSLPRFGPLLSMLSAGEPVAPGIVLEAARASGLDPAPSELARFVRVVKALPRPPLVACLEPARAEPA